MISPGRPVVSESEGALRGVLRCCIPFGSECFRELDFPGFSLWVMFCPDSPNHATPVGRGQMKRGKEKGGQNIGFMENTVVG